MQSTENCLYRAKMVLDNENVEIHEPTIRLNKSRVPMGIRLLIWFQKDRDKLYRCHIFIATFIAYASYHLSRKPISVVKDTLNANCSNYVNTSCPAWEPFDGKDSKSLLGYLDASFLAAYAVGMFISGFVAEHMDIRLFLTAGMFLSGFFSILFGFGYFLKIHSLTFFILMQVLAGFAQSSGWPAVVEAIGNWFGKGQRGLIMGIWNSHASVGNIVGSAVAAVWSDDRWGWSFVVPGLMIIGAGFTVFFFLVVDPSHVDCSPPEHHLKPRTISRTVNDEETDSDQTSLLNNYTQDVQNMVRHSRARKKGQHGADSKAISFFGALCLPGVIEYSLCLFFAKLVSYTFLYWLPYYINHTDIGGIRYDSRKAGDLSSFFDVGGIIGGIVAGVISDRTNCSGITCVIMLVLAAPAIFIYRFYSNNSLLKNVVLMIVSGIFVNGPYGLITTAVSANLATQKALRGDTKAMAIVTAIIDGTGSLGAALGPLLTSFFSNNNWNDVFYMLITANILAAMLLTRQVSYEIKKHVLHKISSNEITA
ncbi:glucose-6-phosphate exchanger SLC37A2-like [Xenia sp. Carnegie-2017]|uniref:glucose-6-phosphate exchanger SLC37A2-like n=1 Tax=Xenia sp. Carnegie-2017 TaxID=2897299 RepID=UPI001F04ADC8|nr:glucose-6-phosphate exchanger SLC37A2-like [Xenia sp. Carnegie-2017]